MPCPSDRNRPLQRNGPRAIRSARPVRLPSCVIDFAHRRLLAVVPLIDVRGPDRL